MKAKSRWKMKAKIASFRRLLGFLLSIALLLEASGMQVFAAGMQDNIPDTSGVVDIADTANTEDTGNTADVAESYDLMMDKAEPTVGYPADDETGTVDGEDTDIASGKYNGMDWRIDKDGLLTIEGEYQKGAPSGTHWQNYSDQITSAKVTATGVKSTAFWFKDCINLRKVELSEFDSSNVTDMCYMFNKCSSLTNLYLRNFNTSNVTNMSYMFFGCSSLTNLNLSNFNTSIVSDMEGMFSYCSSLTHLDLSNFDTGMVTNMQYMFSRCSSLTNLDLSNFNTSMVSDMEGMFSYCSSLTDLNLDNFNTSAVTDMNEMFYSCNLLTNLDLSNFDTSAVTDMSAMFYGCSSLTNLNLSNFDTSTVTDMALMFDGCSLLTNLNLSNFNTSAVTDMMQMFYGCSSLTNLNLSSFDTSAVTDMARMFCRCSSLTDLNLSNFDTSAVTDMARMFDRCSSLTNLNLNSFNTSMVTNMGSMFTYCSSLTDLMLDNFNTSAVTDMHDMFFGCSSLTNLNLSNFDTSNLDTSAVYSMRYMFYHCDNLEWINTPINLNIDIDLPHVMIDADGNTYSTLPRGLATSIRLTKPSTGGETEDKDCIASGKYCGMDWRIDKNGLLTISGEYQEDDAYTDSSWPWLDYTNEVISAKVIATNVKLMNHWFNNCSKLQSIDFTDFDTSQVTDMSNIFDGCSSLTGLDLSNMNLARLETADHMLDYCSNLEWINAPTNLSVSIALPFPMCDENGNAYIALPLGQAVSKKLTYTDGLAVTAIADQTYTGKAIKPSITVTYGKRTLTPGVDYTVTYKNNTNAAASDSAKAPAVIVKGKGNYTDSITETFNILAKPLTESDTTVASMAYTSDGKVKKPTPAVTVDGVKLKAGKDYIVEFPDTVSGAYRQPGRYTVTIKGTGNYQGTVTAALVILAKDQIQASKLKIGKLPACTYIEGTPAAPVPTVTYAGKALVQDKDYTISYRNNDRVGKATLIITGLENTDPQGVYVYGTVERTFSIKGTALNKARVNYDNKASFTGSAICPVITLTLNGAVLRPDTDYTVSYSNNINAGKATITLTGCGGYTGTVKKIFTIRPAETDTDKLDVVFAKDSATASYSQSGAKPAVTVKINGTTLQSGKDYTVTYKNNKKPAGTDAAKAPTIIIKGKGNYKFQKSLTFSILEKSLNDTDIAVSAPDTFLGAKGSLLAAPTVIDGDGKKLKAGRDYIVTGYFINGQEFDGRSQVSSNTPVTVKLRGTGCYTGEIGATYRITAKDISKTKVTVSQIEFNGGTTVLTDKMIQEGKIKVTDKATGQELVYGTDYIITGYQNNAKKGKATLTIQGTGENYGGTKAVKFSIVAKKLKK